MIEVKPVIDLTVRALCKKPYPRHKHGCPNWNKKEGCPPKALPLNKVFDLTTPVYVVYNRFNLGDHVTNMINKHPDWSEAQLKCVLYWQSKARKELKNKVNIYLKSNKDLVANYCPEGNGVNVTETMKQIGIKLKYPPEKYAYQIAFLGTPIKNKEK